MANRTTRTPPPPLTERLQTPDEVADRLRISVSTLRNWVGLGTVPSHRVGRRIMFTEDDVVEILAQARTPATAPMRNGVSHRRAAR